jgi:hypothetical protein
MPSTCLTCPNCSKSLRLDKAPHPGRPVRCPWCTRTFTAGSEAIARAPALAVAPSLVVPGGPSPRRGLLLAVVVGGLVLLVGTTVLAVRLAARSDRSESSRAAVDSTSSPAPAAAETGSASSGGTTIASGTPQTDRSDDPGRAPPTVDLPSEPPPAGRPPDLKGPGADAPGATEPVGAPPLRESDPSALPREMQAEVNRAIDKGLAYLKGKQQLSGSWEGNYTTAYAALPALTLLECGVPASDPLVQKAAAFVRGHVRTTASNRETYELSLALLFLDQLGEEKDRPIIRSIALRLVAGQTPDGGWTYRLPELAPKEEDALENFLQKTRPEDLGRVVQLPDGRRLDPAVLRPSDQKPLDRPVSSGQGSRQGNANGGPSGGQQGSSTPGSKPDSSAAGSKPFEPPPPKKEEERKKPLTQAEAKKEATKLPPRLRTVPAVVDATNRTFARAAVGRHTGSDNSNTQFATLALWAASRYDLPLERSLDALARRFQKTQTVAGTWNYHPVTNPGAQTSPAMTGAGLLGLAVGHGVRAGKEKVADKRVEKGFHALAGHIGKPFGADKKVRRMKRGTVRTSSPINLYFLWTIERVGVLYNVRTLDGKDWYRWGAELLVDAQKPDGSWQEGNYHGSGRTLDTCLGLLFLKRANLATDLTRKLELVIDGRSALGSSAPR